jgi:hypothetical protein
VFDTATDLTVLVAVGVVLLTIAACLFSKMEV